MGRLCVEKFLHAGAEVAVMNRGRTPSPFRDHPRVRHIKCDRDDRKRFRRLMEMGATLFCDAGDGPGSKRKQDADGAGEQQDEAGPRSWDAVVDFVCFRPKNMRDVINAAVTKHYVFISTDSVYMACDIKKLADKISEGPLLEEHTFAPTDEEELIERNEYQYTYGKRKLDCEDVLKVASSILPQYTILRLPDV